MLAHEIAKLNEVDAIHAACEKSCFYMTQDWEKETTTYVFEDQSVVFLSGPTVSVFNNCLEAAEDWYNRSTKEDMLKWASQQELHLLQDEDLLDENWPVMVIGAYARFLRS